MDVYEDAKAWLIRRFEHYQAGDLMALFNTILSIIQIEQTQINSRIETQNRNFQNTVAVAGVGISTASLTATAGGPLIQQITTPQSPEAKPSTTSLIITWGGFLTCWVLLRIVAGWLTYYLRNHKPQKTTLK